MSEQNNSSQATASATRGPQAQTQAQTEVVTELNNNDVLLGRGASSSEYTGNLRLRALVLQRRKDYYSCSRRNEKHLMAMEIIQTIHDRGGRFLQRITTVDEARELGVPPLTQAWKVVHASSALFIKVKQLMRDVGEETQKKRKIRREEKRRLARLNEGDTKPPGDVKSGQTVGIIEVAKLSSPQREGNEFADDSSLSSGGSGTHRAAAAFEAYVTSQHNQQSSHEKPAAKSTEPRIPVTSRSHDQDQSYALTSMTDVSALSTASSASAVASAEPSNAQHQLAVSLVSKIIEQQRQQQQQQQQQQQLQQAQNILANLLQQSTQVPASQNTQVHLPQVLQSLSTPVVPSRQPPQLSTSNDASSANGNEPPKNQTVNSLQSLDSILPFLLASPQPQFPLPPPQPPPPPQTTTSSSVNVQGGDNVANVQPLVAVLQALSQQSAQPPPRPLPQPLPNHSSSSMASAPQEETSNTEQSLLVGILLQALLQQQQQQQQHQQEGQPEA